MTQAGFEQIANGDSRNPGALLPACLKADEIGFANVDFCCVLDHHKAVFVGNKVGKNIKQSGFAGPCAAADEDVFPVLNCSLKEIGHCFSDSSNADKHSDAAELSRVLRGRRERGFLERYGKRLKIWKEVSFAEMQA